MLNKLNQIILRCPKSGDKKFEYDYDICDAVDMETFCPANSCI